MRPVVLMIGMSLDGIAAEGWFPLIEDEALMMELHEEARRNLG